MSFLNYNGITLGGITTNGVARNVRLSDDGVDYLWSDFVIDVNFIYSSAVTSYPVYGVLPPTTDAAIRSVLMQPRAPLVFSEGGVVILETVGLDCEDGPIPQSLTITRIAGSNLFFGRYVIKASVIECPAGSVITAVASSRYSRTESIDAQYRSTMVTSGKAYFRSNVLAFNGINADAFRGFIVPQPMLGYQRRSIQVGLSSNGIVMEFAVVDVEVFVDLGSTDIPGTAGSAGIVDMDLDFTTNTINKGEIGFAGLMVAATCSAVAVGTKFSDTWNMTQFLYQCVYSKLGWFTQNGICVDVSYRESVFKKVVSLSMTYHTMPNPQGQPLPPPDLAIGLAGVVGMEIPELPPTDGIEPFPPFSNATRGTAAFQLAVNAFAVACLPISPGGCDQTGATPPDIDYYGGQCAGPVNIVTYEVVDTPTGEDFRVAGKDSFRGPNPGKVGYINYSLRKDVVTDKGTAQVSYSATQKSLGTSPGNPASPSPTPTSTPTPTSAVLQLMQPTTTVSYKFSIERFGCVPEVPDPTATLDGYTLLEAIRSPLGIEIMPDGYTPVYRITGTYTYASIYPVLETDTIPFDIPAWVNYDPGPYTEVEGEDYIEGVIQNPPQD